MPNFAKAQVFMSGRSQHVTIPAEYRFTTDEVYIRRDSKTGDLILSQRSGNLADILAALDKLGVPDSFLSPAERKPSRAKETKRAMTLLYMLDTNMVS